MAKRQISKTEFALMQLAHRSLESRGLYTNSYNVWIVDGIRGSQTYSHPSYGLFTVEVQTNLETEEKTYWVFEPE